MFYLPHLQSRYQTWCELYFHLRIVLFVPVMRLNSDLLLRKSCCLPMCLLRLIPLLPFTDLLLGPWMPSLPDVKVFLILWTGPFSTKWRLALANDSLYLHSFWNNTRSLMSCKLENTLTHYQTEFYLLDIMYHGLPPQTWGILRLCWIDLSIPAHVGYPPIFFDLPIGYAIRELITSWMAKTSYQDPLNPLTISA